MNELIHMDEAYRIIGVDCVAFSPEGGLYANDFTGV
jgi:hypothetical protein